jgi:hypothetical protein
MAFENIKNLITNDQLFNIFQASLYAQKCDGGVDTFEENFNRICRGNIDDVKKLASISYKTPLANHGPSNNALFLFVLNIKEKMDDSGLNIDEVKNFKRRIFLLKDNDFNFIAATFAESPWFGDKEFGNKMLKF